MAELKCYQGFLNLVDCTGDTDGGLLVYPRSHLVHSAFINAEGNVSAKNWYPVPADRLRVLRADIRPYLPEGHPHKLSPEPVTMTPTRVRAKAGQMVIFDSRTLHRGVLAVSTPEQPSTYDRAVVYICMLPWRNVFPDEATRDAAIARRLEYVAAGETTNHWPHELGNKPKVDVSGLGDPREVIITSVEQLEPVGRKVLGSE